MNEPKKRIKLDDINLVIFDMDGLIFDTESIYIRKGYEITKRYGYDITEEVIMKTIGMTDKSSREIYKTAYGQDFPYDLMTKEIDSYIVDLGRKGELPFMNGAIEIFEYFKNNDKKMVVATSSRREKAEILLKNSEIIEYFEYVVCGDDITHGKPNPEIFLKAATEINALPNETLVLEDSLNGIRAAHAANMVPMMIPDKILSTEEIRKMYYMELPNLLNVIEYFDK